MKECFGEVNNGIVLRNAAGETAHQLWLQILEHHNSAIINQCYQITHTLSADDFGGPHSGTVSNSNYRGDEGKRGGDIRVESKSSGLRSG